MSLIFLLLPSYLLKIRLFPGASFNFLDVLIILAILTHWKTLRPQKTPCANRSSQIAVLLILLGFGLSFLANLPGQSWTDSLGALKSFLVLPLLFAFLLAKIKKQNRSEFQEKNIFLPFFILTSILGILGYLYTLFGALTFDQRVRLFFDSPNSLAMLLAPGLIIGIFFLGQKKFQKKSTLFLILTSLAFQLFTLWNTACLAALLALILIAANLILKKIATKTHQKNSATFCKPAFRFFSLGLWFFPLIFSISLFFLPAALKTVDYAPKIPANSWDSRIAIWRSAKKIIQEHWLWGVGATNFQKNYLQNQAHFPPYPQWAVPHAHNNLWHFWIEGGLFAALGLLILTALLAKKYWLFSKKLFPSPTKTQHQTELKSKIKNSSLNLELLQFSLLLYFFLHGSVDVTLWKNDLALIFWSLLFLTLTPENESESNQEHIKH